MPTSFRQGMGVAWEDSSPEEDEDVAYGVVLNVFPDDSLEVARVHRLHRGMRCYDEGGSTYEEDRDKVRLESIYAPFADMRATAGRGLCYADGNRDHFKWFSAEDAREKLVPVDPQWSFSKGKCYEVYVHIWWDELQREKIYVDDGVDRNGDYEFDDVYPSLMDSVAEGDFIPVSESSRSSTMLTQPVLSRDVDIGDSGGSLFAAVNDAAEKYDGYFSESTGQEDAQSSRSAKMQEAFSRIPGGGLPPSGASPKQAGPSL